MSELKITKDSLENAILKDGLFVSGYVADAGYISASGSGAHAEGYIAEIGGQINASGYSAIARGYVDDSGSINAIGNSAHAEGHADNGEINVSGDGAIAMGYAYDGGHINASGDGAHAEGYAYFGGKINASGDGAHAEGYAADNGEINAIGHGAHAEGSCTTAFGEFSHVEGWGEPISSSTYELSNISPYNDEKTTCTLNPPLTLSTCNIYIGSIIKFSDNNSTKYSIVSGTKNNLEFIVNNTIDSTFTTILVHTGASGTASHAEGKSTLAYSTASHAEGYNTRASGNYSHAEGLNTETIGTASHAEGYNTRASGNYSHAGGLGTIANSVAMTVIGKYNGTTVSNILFTVGNGTSPTQRSNAFWVKDDGTAHATGGFYDESDIRKKDILSNISLEKSYELLDKCQEIIYTLKEDPNKKEQVGMIAQEVEEFFPEIVSTDNNGFKSLDYARLSVICLRLIKDIVELIKELKNEIKNLNG